MHPRGDPPQYLRPRRHRPPAEFIEKITQLNGGRAFFTTPETLGDYVLVDFIEHRRAMGRFGRSA